MDSQNSVMRWLADLTNGDGKAADNLVRRYLDRLIRVGRTTYRRKFGNMPRPAEDEEDAALSALDSFLGGQREGKFCRLQDQDDLWRLLVTITVRKIYDQRERSLAKKRGGGRVVGALRNEAASSSSNGADPHDQLASTYRHTGSAEQAVDDLTDPQVRAEVADTLRTALASLGDTDLRRIAEMTIDGKTKEEIAEELGINQRTVFRRLKDIRNKWDTFSASDR